ncbi:RHS repeat-associated core domain-containing protein [Acidovorax sp.]|uniref:RHS repeat-associated core domain-containing protein n=1 Tax=Acidovorax sp. TaxID=1872122 RepID=UPI00391F8666
MALTNTAAPANASALNNGMATNSVARPLDDKTLAAMQADDELFVPTEANRKGLWISGKAERAQLALPRNQKLREALYGEQERLQKILEQRAADAGIDLKAKPQASAYSSASVSPVSLDGVITDSTLRNASTTTGTSDSSASTQKVRLEWSDIAHAASPAGDKRAVLSNAKSDTASGTTSLAGQVLRLNGKPLANVTLSVAGAKVKTDDQGEFLLTGLPAGPQVLSIDGRSANRADAQYGVFQYRLDIQAGQANTLPFVVWMPKLDTRNAVKIDSPTRSETVISHPLIPGLQVVLPAGTVVRDADGKVVTEVSITPVPVDQTPFPMPFVGVPVFYTLQPGGAVLQGVDGKPRAATLKYPNYTSFGPGEPMQLFDYDPQGRGWYVYSQAKVSSTDPTTIAAAEPFNVYQFTIHSISVFGKAGGGACGCGCGGGGSGGGDGGGWGQGGGGGGSGSCGGDPVDMTTGHFVHIERDLMINDVLAIDIRRTYRSLDNKENAGQEHIRAFGVGTTHNYDIYLRAGNQLGGNWKLMQLIMPNGRVVPFKGTLDGTIYQTYSNFESSGEFRGAKIKLVDSTFVLFFRDGRQWGFTKFNQLLKWMDDRNGNRINIDHRSLGAYDHTTRITAPNGRWVEFTYKNFLVEKSTDHIGRSFTYTYDASQRLTEVTDPLGKKRIYTWDAVKNRITSIKDPNGNTRVTNEYDTAGRVKKQTLADGSTYQWVYTLDGAGNMSQVDFTDRRGTVRRLNFDPQGWLVKNTFALGKPEQYVETYEITDGLRTAKVDGLGRRTQYEYDTVGNLLKITRLAGTANAVSTTITYDPVFNQPLTITNPLGHKFTLTYNTKGNLTKVSDPLGNAYNITYDIQGKPLNITNPVSKVTKLAWDGADLSTVTDALNRVMQYRTDGAGRVQSITDPLGNRTLQDWDALNRLTQITNPLGNTIKFGYDNNGFLTTQVDEKNNPTATSTYNGTGQRISVKDALNQMETMAYDAAGQLRQRIDRKGQLSSVTYDALSRTKRIGFGATAAAPTAFKSVVELSWDAANRLTQVLDKTCTNPTTSLNCATVGSTQTTTLTYDNLDRLIKEVTPQGEVNYTYDAADRRTSMTVKNGAPAAQTTQPTLSYTWDNASRLTQISQAAGAPNGGVAQTITLAYDAASRRTQTKLANGSTITYTYDDADQLTAMDYKKSDGTLIGNLTYTYDKAGRRTSAGGSLAKINLPATNITTATYDANNRLTQWGGKTFSYDQNGNLIADGTSTYQWDERNQLKGVSTGATGLANFQYDAFGRRSGKTVGSTTTGFLYDGDNFVQELSGTANTSSVKAQLITGGLDEIFLREEGINLQSVMADANNNTIRILDKNQAKVVDYSYEAYGKTTADATNTNSQQYTGRENDNPGNDNGLYFYRNRYYMPGCARFLSEDPIGWASGQTNNYSYVGGNPVSLRDPLGLYSCGMPSVDEWWSEAKDAWKTTDSTIDSWFPDIPFSDKEAPMVGSPAKVAALVGGGAAASSFGGQTLGQAVRDAYFPKAVKHPFGPAITPMKTPIYWPRVATTSAITGVATSLAWGIGVAIGSAVSPFANRALDASCY